MSERKAMKELEKLRPQIKKDYEEAKANLLDSFSERVKKGLLSKDEFEKIKKRIDELEEMREKKWGKKTTSGP